MKTVELETTLNAAPDRVWEELKKPELLLHIAAGVLSFRPIKPPAFPPRWTPGEYEVAMLWKGFLPVGRQMIVIEYPEPKDGARFVRDNGRGGLIRTWDHLITVAPLDDGRTRYVDRVRIEAGALTPFVVLFAERFYRHRQKRWRELAENDFDYAAC